MIVVRDAATMAGIDDPLVRQRYAEISAVGDVHFVIVQVGDSVAALEQETCCPIMHNLFDADIHFGHADYYPSFEVLTEHARCYEMVFILSDGGDGVAIFIPKVIGIAPELLAFCREYATSTIEAK